MTSPSNVPPSALAREAAGEELAELRERLAALEQAQRDAAVLGRQRRNRWAAAAVVLALTAGTWALAAPGDCPNGMPFCFSAGSPASAAQVNENFADLRSLSAAWVSRPASSIPITQGARQLVTSVTLPAGRYVVQAKLYGVSGGTTQNLLCGLYAGAVNLDFNNSHPVNSYATVPLLGSVTLATSGAVTVECQTNGAVNYTLYGVSLVATPVSALN